MRFTFVLEYGEEYKTGRYLHQEIAPDLPNAIVQWAKNLNVQYHIWGMGSKTKSQLLEEAHNREYDIIPITGLKKVWSVLFMSPRRYFDLTVIGS